MSQRKEHNRRIVLAKRPQGAPVPENFRLENTPVPDPAEGQVLLRTEYLSLDPYMRGRMSDAPSYAEPVKVNEVMVECNYAKTVLGFDACLDHKSSDFAQQLSQACSNGIDIYFESVGGKVFDAALPLLNTKARIPVCGLISHYNATRLPEGPDRLSLLMRTILVKRLKVQGFIIFDDYGHRYGEFSKEMSQWLSTGQIKYREHIVDGLENAPDAFIGMLVGQNFGKLVVRVNDER